MTPKPLSHRKVLGLVLLTGTELERCLSPLVALEEFVFSRFRVPIEDIQLGG